MNISVYRSRRKAFNAIKCSGMKLFIFRSTFSIPIIRSRLSEITYLVVRNYHDSFDTYVSCKREIGHFNSIQKSMNRKQDMLSLFL